MKKWAFSLTLILASFAANAEVKNKSESGFNIEISRTVSVDPLTAYNEFVDVADWWVESHSWFGSRKNFSIDARAGGCFCEIDGDRQVLHMQVTYTDPGREIKMVGGLGPLQMMGLHGGMSWRFEESDEGTLIIQSYNVTGYAPGGLLDLADIVDAVQTSQIQALVNHISEATK